MHDILEDVARYDIALIIYGLIEQKYFTLEELNNRIIMFNYGVTEKKILLQLFEIVILKKVVLLCPHRKCFYMFCKIFLFDGWGVGPLRVIILETILTFT